MDVEVSVLKDDKIFICNVLSSNPLIEENSVCGNFNKRAII